MPRDGAGSTTSRPPVSWITKIPATPTRRVKVSATPRKRGTTVAVCVTSGPTVPTPPPRPQPTHALSPRRQGNPGKRPAKRPQHVQSDLEPEPEMASDFDSDSDFERPAGRAPPHRSTARNDEPKLATASCAADDVIIDGAETTTTTTTTTASTRTPRTKRPP